MSDLIEAHVAHLRATGYSERTITSRSDILRRLHQHLDYGLAWATTEGIQAFLADGRWSRWTRCTYDMHIRSAYTWWTENGWLDGNPVTWPAPRRPRLVPRPATDEELAAALAMPEPVRTAALLAAYEGLRASECARSWREHLTETTLYVPQGKGGDPAMLVTHPIVWQQLRDRGPGPLIVHPETGEPVTGKWLIATSRRWFVRAGLAVRLHRLRHWHATAMLRAGANIRTVQEHMRHAALSSTAGYTKVVDEQRRAAVLALPNPLEARARL